MGEGGGVAEREWGNENKTNPFLHIILLRERILHNSKVILTTSLGTNAIVVTRVHCICLLLLTFYVSHTTFKFSLTTSSFSLTTSHFSLTTSYFPLSISYFSLSISYFSLTTSYFSLTTSYFSLTTSCISPTINFENVSSYLGFFLLTGQNYIRLQVYCLFTHHENMPI